MIEAGKEYQVESKTGVLLYDTAKPVKLQGRSCYSIGGHHFTEDGIYLRQTIGFSPSWVEGDQMQLSDVDPYRKQAYGALVTLREIQALTKTLLSGGYGDVLACGLASEDMVEGANRVKSTLERIKAQIQETIESKESEFPELD